MLEIGTFVGFSVATWCHAVGGDGTVTGLEKSPEWAKLSREKLKQYGFDNAEVITGDALERYVTDASTTPSLRLRC